MTRVAISRRRFLQSVAALAAPFGPWAACRSDAAPPDLLILVADDLRADTLGFAGDVNARTPHLDALAGRAVWFRENFVTTSICATSRASLLTGQYGRRHGVWSFTDPLRDEQLALSYPAQLKRAGYHTGFVGKYGIGTGWASDGDDVFDVWRGFFGQGRYWVAGPGQSAHLTDQLAAQAAAFLEEAPVGRPFCLSVSFKAPHVEDPDEQTDPFQPHPRFLLEHAKTVFPRPSTAGDEYFERLPRFLRDSEARRRWQTRFAEGAQFQDSLRKYYALVTGLDAAVGEILTALARSGRSANTVVVFTSDNGFFLGEHGLAGKWYGFEESIRTPLLLAVPGVPRSEVRVATLNIDLAPTLLELAGVAPPEAMQGRSMAALLRGQRPVPSWRRDWYYEHRLDSKGISKSEGVRTARHKYLVHYEEAEPNVLLFDLERDPDEAHNIAATAEAELLAGLEARLAMLRAEAGPEV